MGSSGDALFERLDGPATEGDLGQVELWHQPKMGACNGAINRSLLCSRLQPA
jgi:hypothetical protein